TGTLTYPVLADNDAPVVLDDILDVAQNGSLTVPAAGVLVNDVDPDEDGPGLTVTVEDAPTGDLALNPDGSFTYTPTLDFTGEDSFTYVASDSVMTATGTVTLNIAAPMQETIAVSGAGTYPFGSICGSLTFTSTGTVDTFTVTLSYGYPSVNGDGLPRRYDIEAKGTGFSAALTLCYEDNDLLVAGIDPAQEPNLHAYRYVGSGQPWAEYSLVDTANNTVTAFEVSELGVWGIGTTSDQPTALVLNTLLARGGLWAMGLVAAMGLAIIYPRRKRQ
ncbi:MAG: Ig-like domain-containing protein, partial [Anaerolineae bacterium]